MWARKDSMATIDSSIEHMDHTVVTVRALRPLGRTEWQQPTGESELGLKQQH